MRIPFEYDVDDLNEAAGFLYLEDDFLVFELQVLALGLVKRESEIIKAERSVIEDIEVRKGLIKDRLVVSSHSIKLLKAIPGRHATEIVLKIKKKHRREAEEFVDRVHLWLDEAGA